MQYNARRFLCLVAALCASGCLDGAGTAPSGGEDSNAYRDKIWTTPPGDFSPVAVGDHWSYREVDSMGTWAPTRNLDSVVESGDFQIDYDILSSQIDSATGDTLYQARERTRKIGLDGTLENPEDKLGWIRVHGNRTSVYIPGVPYSKDFAIPFLYGYRYLDTAQTDSTSSHHLNTALLGSDTLRAYHVIVQGMGGGGSNAWYSRYIYVESMGLLEESTDNVSSYDFLEAKRIRLLEFNGRRFDPFTFRE